MEKSPDTMPSTPPQEKSLQPPANGRRGFLARFFSIVIGGVIGSFPFASGLLVFLCLRESHQGFRAGGFCRTAQME